MMIKDLNLAGCAECKKVHSVSHLLTSSSCFIEKLAIVGDAQVAINEASHIEGKKSLAQVKWI